MKKLLPVLIVIILCTGFSSCQKYLGDPSNPVSYDNDAQKFIDSATITDLVQRFAINNLVIQLKDSSLWSKFVAIYPMLGSSDYTFKWNLKDPRNTDDAYRLSFYGAPVYGAGVLFPTTADYADTHVLDSQAGTFDNASVSYFSLTQNSVSGYDMGCTDGAVPYNELSVYSNSSDNSEWFGFSFNILSPVTTGLFTLSSTPTNVTRYHNGVIVSSKGAPPANNYTNLTILLGKSRVTVHPGQKECGFAAIGNGLTDAQAVTFYNIVQAFQTKVGR